MRDTIASIITLLFGIWVAAHIISKLEIDFNSDAILWGQIPAVMSSVAVGGIFWMVLYAVYEFVIWKIFVARRNRE